LSSSKSYGWHARTSKLHRKAIRRIMMQASRKSLEEQEKKAQESDDLEEAKKAVAALENLIWKHRMQESYFCIKYVFKPGQGGGLQ
jgi:hypothetical protein